MVPIPQNAIATIFQPGTSLFIIFHLFRVLATIEFDDQLLFKTDEIYDVRPDRMLSSKFVRAHLTHAEMFPKQPLCVG